MIGNHLPDGPLVEFFQLVSDGFAPRRADKSVGGLIPARALRYCEAMTTASGFGYYVFLPMSFKLVWDGHDILWTYDGVDEWLPFTPNAVQYPGFAQRFDRMAPPQIRGFSPTFLAPSVQPGMLQVWTGCVARTAPGWSLLVRGVANLARSPAYQMFEGVIETDRWFGPLFDNIRLLKTDVPIEFRSDIPFMQVQPVRRDFCNDKFLNNFAVSDISQFSAEDWNAFHDTVVVPNAAPARKPGRYAVSVRKRFAAAPSADPTSERQAGA
jgi:hypothetical protein